MSTNIVILGGGGFIGTNIHAHFIDKKVNSVSISRNFQTNLPKQIINNALTISTLKDYLSPNTTIIDLLNTTSPDELKWHTQLINDLANHPVKKIIFFSSAAIYGNTPISATEKTNPNPTSEYGQSKLKLESSIIESRIPFLIFRLSNAYGPWQHPKKGQIVPSFFQSIISSNQPIINNDGQQIRDYIYIKDIIKIIDSALITKTGIFNLSSNTGTTINQLWEKIQKISQTKIIPKYTNNNISEIRSSILDNQKLLQAINPVFTSLDQGLKETFDWFKNNIKV